MRKPNMVLTFEALEITEDEAIEMELNPEKEKNN